MKQKTFVLALLSVIFVSITGSASAQLFNRQYARASEKPPKAVLVQLFTYPNKLAFLEKRGLQKDIQRLKQDAAIVAEQMVEDFNQNFTYAPVYYYYDTNISYIREQKFEGVLLDRNLKPVAKPIIAPGDEYVIAIFGYNTVEPTDNPYGKDNEDDYFASNYTTTRDLYRLVILDERLRKVFNPLPNGGNIKKGKFTHKNRDLEIYYRESAAGYSYKLADFYGPYPY